MNTNMYSNAKIAEDGADLQAEIFFPFIKAARATVDAHYSGLTDSEAAMLELQLAKSLMQQKYLQSIEATLIANNKKETF